MFVPGQEFAGPQSELERLRKQGYLVDPNAVAFAEPEGALLDVRGMTGSRAPHGWHLDGLGHAEETLRV